jgi:regulator of sirC expression with transglutaminase-like and TPR domain
MIYLLKYSHEGEEFFVDVFHGGVILSRGDCVRKLEEFNIAYRSDILQPSTNRLTIARMLNNLATIYRVEDSQLAHVVTEAIERIAGPAFGGNA